MKAFVGRDRELTVLGAVVRRAAEDGPTRAVIAAPLGYGVSRLLEEFASRVAKSGVVVCRAECREPQAGVPYAALSAALAPALARLSERRLIEVVGPAGYDLSAVMPSLTKRLEAARIPNEPPALDSPRQRGARVREALIGVLDRLAGEHLVCLIVEDIEHSDAGTRELLGSLLRTSHRLPLALIVGVHPREIGRSHPARRFLDQLDDSLDLDRIELGPLDEDEIAALAQATLGEKATLAFLAALKEGSGGSPLLAEQLIAAQQELEGARLSDPLEQTVDARLSQLDRQQVRVLRALAAARDLVSPADLASLRLDDGHLPRNASALVEASGLVRERDGGVEVAHQLLAEAIEEGMLPAQRQSMHAALAGLDDQSAAQRAWHLERAARPSAARAAHVEAATVAQRVEPGSTALAHLVAALALAGDVPIEDEVELLAAAASAADAAGAFRRAAAFCSQAIERVAGGRVERLMTTRADAAARARAAALCRQLGEFKRSGGDTAGARESFELAVAVAPHDPARAGALAALAQQLMLEGDFVASAARAEEARAAAVEGGDRTLAELAHAMDTAAVDAGYAGDIDRALALLDLAFDAARRAGDLDEVMRCYANKTTLLDLDLRREEALAVVKEGIAEAARNGLGLTYGAFLGGNAADILFQLGRWTEAEAECRAAMGFPPAGVAWFSPILYLGLVVVEARADEEASQLVGKTLLQLETVPAGQWSSLVLRTAVSLALWRGDIGDAVNAAEQGWRRVLETEDPVQIVVGAATVLEACAEAADAGRIKRDWSIVAAASSLANAVLPVAETSLARHPLPRTVGARREVDVYMATARAHSERVRGHDRPEMWAALAEAWATIPVPYQVAKARWWQAQAALPTRARRAEARRALREAWKAAESLPAGPLLTALRDLADRGRIAVPAEELVAIPIQPDERQLVPVGPAPVGAGVGGVSGQPPELARFGLSPREYGVLLVLAEGRTNREIAERLFISERTVAVHVRRILSKLGVSGRVEAAGVAIRLGLLPDDPRLRQPVSVR